ncbi:zf-met domain-containing protein [Cephalotus follicularis]|uniref:Zf-met domain-containing protein n=1 Tax=Cephalotus follicularis TaxID=3775 RepID=A0A1Q3AXU8_CEPFO|nr:zf-met domain-containing protein [Cephalotus follicularis]
MDAKAKKKALFRAKLNAQKKDKRIDSPLVRYNEFDQPVCRVCDVVLKSESLWDAHQVSRKHREAISNIKANAAGHMRVDNAKPEHHIELPKPKPEHTVESQNTGLEFSSNLPKRQPSSGLPADFFENNETKRPKSGKDAVELVERDWYKKVGVSAAQTLAIEYNDLEDEIDGSSNVTALQTKGIQFARELSQKSTQTAGLETKQQKGALPEGFFDNKEADLRARGIKPVKLDIKDEYKEFEKLIQEDLQEVDDRFEEEEIDAAEVIEEAESLEQKAYREKVEMLKKKKMELKAARSAKRSRGSKVAGTRSSREQSSSDDEDDENFAVDWRAQHL